MDTKDVDDLLEGMKGKLTTVIIIGTAHDGTLSMVLAHDDPLDVIEDLGHAIVQVSSRIGYGNDDGQTTH